MVGQRNVLHPRAVELNGTGHIMGGERDGADALDIPILSVITFSGSCDGVAVPLADLSPSGLEPGRKRKATSITMNTAATAPTIHERFLDLRGKRLTMAVSVRCTLTSAWVSSTHDVER